MDMGKRTRSKSHRINRRESENHTFFAVLCCVWWRGYSQCTCSRAAMFRTFRANADLQNVVDTQCTHGMDRKMKRRAVAIRSISQSVTHRISVSTEQNRKEPIFLEKWTGSECERFECDVESPENRKSLEMYFVSIYLMDCGRQNRNHHNISEMRFESAVDIRTLSVHRHTLTNRAPSIWKRAKWAEWPMTSLCRFWGIIQFGQYVEWEGCSGSSS